MRVQYMYIKTKLKRYNNTLQIKKKITSNRKTMKEINKNIKILGIKTNNLTNSI